MKTLVIPDLHQAPVLEQIETTIQKEQPDLTVFLGDYFDHFDDVPDDARRMADWLSQSLEDPQRLHLVGNHDVAYLWPGPATTCPGYTEGKRFVIEEALGKQAAVKFRFHLSVDGWLLSHAGLASVWLPRKIDLSEIPSWLTQEEQHARTAFAEYRMHWFAAIGERRGGYSPAGGILWCDLHELEKSSVKGLKQLVGHTPGRDVRWKGPNCICLDTNLGRGPQKYAVLEDGQIRIGSFESFEPS